MNSERISSILFRVIDEVNQSLPEHEQLAKTADTVLIGDESKLDSLGLVNLIMLAEERIHAETGVPVSLASDDALFRKDGPFKTIGSLAIYIESRISAASGGA